MTTESPIQPTPIHNQTNPILSPSLNESTASGKSPVEVPRGPVTAPLFFYAPPKDGSKPWNYVEDPPAGQPKFNYQIIPHDASIADIRGREHAFTLDANAFQAIRDATPSALPSASDFFDDDARIKRLYYPEVERLLLANMSGATRVLLFDHTIRRAQPNAHRAPVQRVHIDQTPWSAAERVRVHLPDEAEALLRGRYRIVNVWRPLNGPVVSHPLAVADSATVVDEDLVGIEHRYPHRTGETAMVKNNANHKWYYWSGMGNDERLLLKCFDSDEVLGRNGRVPHTAFADPRTPEGAPQRESIEVRALVFG